jgi:hypothetical protein
MFLGKRRMFRFHCGLFCLNKDILGLVFAAWWEEDWLVDFFFAGPRVME